MAVKEGQDRSTRYADDEVRKDNNKVKVETEGGEKVARVS